MGSILSTNIDELQNKIIRLQNMNKNLEINNQNIIKEHKEQNRKYTNLEEEFRREQEISIQKDKKIEILHVEIHDIKKQLTAYQGMKNAISKIDNIVDQFGSS